jgi:acetyl esterase
LIEEAPLRRGLTPGPCSAMKARAYARKLTAAGVTVTSTRYNGTIHDFVMLNALTDTPAARAAIAQANAFLRNALVLL